MNEAYLPPPEIGSQLHNLRVFAAVADAGSVARAAGQLHRASSAITRSVIELERTLSVALFERTPRGMLLTPYGNAARARARAIEAETESAGADLRTALGPASSASGILSILTSGRKLLLVAELAALANISAAADRLGISQAGASMALSRIEATLGQPLFQRRLDGMIAGDTARRLARHAARVFAELRHLESDVAGLGGGIGGAVVVGTTPIGRTHVFTAAIAAASARHPALRVATVESNYPELLERLRDGEIDIVVGALRAEAERGVVAERLFVDRLAVLLRAGHPLLRTGRAPSMTELLAARWILPPAGVLGRSIIEDRFRMLELSPPRPAIETGDPAIVRQLLTTTDMVAAVSPHQVAAEMRLGAIVESPLGLPGTLREVGMLQREGALLSGAAHAVAGEIREEAARQRARDA